MLMDQDLSCEKNIYSPTRFFLSEIFLLLRVQVP